MRKSLDQTTDYSYQETHSFLHVTSLPSFVKAAEVLTKEATDNLPIESFADRYHRAFPIETAASVYVSNAFFLNKKAELEDLWGSNFVTEVEARIKKAAELFNVEADIERYNADTLTKSAVDYNEQFVASFEIGGKDYQLFPFKTAEDLTKAASQFNNNIKNYPFGWRKGIADNFVKKAEEFGVEELPDLICKYAGLYYPDTRLFKTELNRRMNKISNEEAKGRYKGCIEKSAGASSRDEYFNICAEAYNIEKSAGVYDNNYLYTQLGDVIDRTFTLSMYKVAELLDVIQMAGEPFDLQALQKVSKDIYKEAFGIDLNPGDAGSLRDTLPTMPLSDVALFRELSGVNPL